MTVTNWFTNPRAVASGLHDFTAGGSGSGAFVTGKTGFANGTSTAYRITNTAAGWVVYMRDDYAGMPLGAHTLQFQARRSLAAGTLTVTPEWYDAAGAAVTEPAQSFPIAKSTVQTFTLTVQKPSANHTTLRLVIEVTGGTATTEVLQVTNFAITSDGTWFAGDSVDTAADFYDWTGAPDASASTHSVGAPDTILFDAAFADQGFAGYAFQPAEVTENVDYGVATDPAGYARTVGWSDSSRGLTMGNEFPRVSIKTGDFVLPNANGNSRDEYWMGFAFYLPSEYLTGRMMPGSGWLTLVTGAFGEPWGIPGDYPSPLGLAVVADADGRFYLQMGADPGLLYTEVKLNTWYNIAQGWKMAYQEVGGWVELYRSVGAGNTAWEQLPIAGDMRHPFDPMRHNVNDSWFTNPAAVPCSSSWGSYGDKPYKVFCSGHRLARTKAEAMAIVQPVTDAPGVGGSTTTAGGCTVPSSPVDFSAQVTN